MSKKAVILLSGGLDSATVLAVVKTQGFEPHAISFSYGQRHNAELTAAERVAKALGAHSHRIVALPQNMFASSALTSNDIDVPDYQETKESVIPVTYVPARNTIFLSIALGYAESIGAFDIFIGASHVDYSGYPDCRPEYIESFEKMANLATKAGVSGQKTTIHAPLMYLSKKETIELGIQHGVDYAMTVSCYQAHPSSLKACGKCDSCIYRKKGFKEANIADPTGYI